MKYIFYPFLWMDTTIAFSYVVGIYIYMYIRYDKSSCIFFWAWKTSSDLETLSCKSGKAHFILSEVHTYMRLKMSLYITIINWPTTGPLRRVFATAVLPFLFRIGCHPLFPIASSLRIHSSLYIRNTSSGIVDLTESF